MALTLPTLDDRTYADLAREGVELIPRYAPEWTNHNASDPGITLLELFAYLTEIYLYRLDRISDANKAKFLKLLTGNPAPALMALDEQLRYEAMTLRQPFRAVSDADFELHAAAAVAREGHGGKVARVHSFSRRNLEADTEGERQRDRPGHVSVVAVPSDPGIADSTVQAIISAIKTDLEPRRLITCRVHVVAARYVDVAIRVRVALAPGQVADRVEQQIETAVTQFFDARGGGPDRSGWPLGRSIYTSDLYRRLAAIDGVLRVMAIDWTAVDANRLLKSETGDVVGVRLDDIELPRVRVREVVGEA
jgi:hypothetical protein